MSTFSEILAAHRVHQGDKPDAVSTGRLAEARRLTEFLVTQKGFSFVRLGDFDLAFLLNPTSAWERFGTANKQISGTNGFATPGLNTGQIARLRTALEHAAYVDFWDRQWKDGTLLEQLDLNRSPSALRNPSRETSCILPTWLEHEFKFYCHGRRVLFCGAEAPLLEWLSRRKEFLTVSRAFWPTECKSFFLRPRENGRNLDANLDLIKEDLRAAIQQFNIETLFLSLGGGAKILCCELAEEFGIAAVDFGAHMRSLTYCGSDGNLATRSVHHVFLYRLPFGLFMDALEETYPNLPPEVMLAKAHAQLLLDLQKKEVGWTRSAGEYDFCSENLAHFQQSYEEYYRRYRRLFKISASAMKERTNFLHFCGTHGLTREGRRFLKWFNLKSWLKGKLP